VNTNNYPTLESSDTLVIFAYAPAGLGHLRVTDALYEGLRDKTHVMVLGARDKNLMFMHRLVSVRIGGKVLMELFQWGPQERIFTRVYRNWLIHHSDEVYRQVTTLLDQRLVKPTRVVFVCTHFSLSFQLSTIRKKIEEEYRVTTFLFMQVTDDSPQFIWYVPGADCIFVPSRSTEKTLKRYGESERLPAVSMKVIPYPVSPYFAQELTPHQLAERKNQTKVASDEKIHIVFPVSGAAVGLSYYQTLLESLHAISDRYFFHIISKQVPFTEKFIRTMLTKKYADVSVSDSDREVVRHYSSLFHRQILGYEVTKPSEQAFKALCKPDTKGGIILLFTEPVGRQERDNINFMIRNKFIPNQIEQKRLWQKALRKETLDGKELHRMSPYRGFRLPENPRQAAKYIQWCLTEGIFTRSIQYRVPLDCDENECRPDGVVRFWREVEEIINNKN
jgi:hypothetical protein